MLISIVVLLTRSVGLDVACVFFFKEKKEENMDRKRRRVRTRPTNGKGGSERTKLYRGTASTSTSAFSLSRRRPCRDVYHALRVVGGCSLIKRWRYKGNQKRKRMSEVEAEIKACQKETHSVWKTSPMLAQEQPRSRKRNGQRWDEDAGRPS